MGWQSRLERDRAQSHRFQALVKALTPLGQQSRLKWRMASGPACHQAGRSERPREHRTAPRCTAPRSAAPPCPPRRPTKLASFLGQRGARREQDWRGRPRSLKGQSERAATCRPPLPPQPTSCHHRRRPARPRHAGSSSSPPPAAPRPPRPHGGRNERLPWMRGEGVNEDPSLSVTLPACPGAVKRLLFGAAPFARRRGGGSRAVGFRQGLRPFPFDIPHLPRRPAAACRLVLPRLAGGGIATVSPAAAAAAAAGGRGLRAGCQRGG